MKLGIVSVQDAANCGAYLQGYALQKTLTDLGHEAGFVNRINQSLTSNQFYRLKSRQIFTHPRNYLRKLRSGIIKYRAYAGAWKRLNNVDPGEADCLVLGSDEIWNVEKSRYHDPKYFGVGAKKCIAYAPSCADCAFEAMEALPHVKPALMRMHRIMVRDENTRDNVLRLTGREASLVCDPTVLADFDTAISPAVEKKLGSPYILIYGYKHSEAEEQLTLAFARRHGLKIVSANFYVKWADVSLTLSPLEFPGVVKKAAYVVTSSFHCSIFALKYARPLAVFPSGVKVVTMLARYEAADLIASDKTFEDFSNILLTPPTDPDRVEKAMEKDRQRSLSLLREALES